MVTERGKIYLVAGVTLPNSTFQRLPRGLGNEEKTLRCKSNKGSGKVGVIGINRKRGCSGTWGCNATDPVAV